MKRGGFLQAGLLALVFILLGCCLWLAGSGLRDGNGAVSVETVSLPGGRGTLYLPREAGGTVFSVYVGGEGEDHIHSDAASAARSPAALILGHGLDGARSLAVELSRRNVAVLLLTDQTDPAAAWDWLGAQSFVIGDAMGLFASRGRAADGLALAGKLVGTERECAAVVLSGDEDTVTGAGALSGRNLLVLTGKAPSRDAKLAFFGAEGAAERGFSGFFGEGTARAVVPLGWNTPGFSRRSAMLQVIDWQGSSLGHASGLADGDLIYDQIIFCRCAAGVCLLLAAAVLPCRKKIWNM